MERREIIEIVNHFLVDEFEIEPRLISDNTLLKGRTGDREPRFG